MRSNRTTSISALISLILVFAAAFAQGDRGTITGTLLPIRRRSRCQRRRAGEARRNRRHL